MRILTDHFWLSCLLVMYVNLGFGRFKMRSLIVEGRLSEIEATRFCLNAAGFLGALCVSFEALTRLLNISVECQLELPLTHRSMWPFYGLTLLSTRRQTSTSGAWRTARVSRNRA